MHIYLGKSAHETSLADTRISYEYNFKEKFVILHHIRTVLRSELCVKLTMHLQTRHVQFLQPFTLTTQ